VEINVESTNIVVPLICLLMGPLTHPPWCRKTVDTLKNFQLTRAFEEVTPLHEVSPMNKENINTLPQLHITTSSPKIKAHIHSPVLRTIRKAFGPNVFSVPHWEDFPGQTMVLCFRLASPVLWPDTRLLAAFYAHGIGWMTVYAVGWNKDYVNSNCSMNINSASIDGPRFDFAHY
jgi:hypothetical protein